MRRARWPPNVPFEVMHNPRGIHKKKKETKKKNGYYYETISPRDP